MYSETLGHIAAASGGRLISGKPDLPIQGVFTDTRAPLHGGLFVALRGERFDGNSFARQAVEQGAAAVVLDLAEAAQNLPPHAGVILVQDAREGYLALAAAHRRKLSGCHWFGVTGSVGKSTTKEMLAHILEHGAGWKVHKNPGNFNNAVGVPHTILGVSEEHQAAVLELGSSHPGEIRQLAAVARPDTAVITCAAASHLEAFGSVENIVREKGEILSFQDAADTAVLNADSPYLDLWRNMAKGKLVSFGAGLQAVVPRIRRRSAAAYPCSPLARMSPRQTAGADPSVAQTLADLRLANLRTGATGCASFLVCHNGGTHACELRVPGIYQAANALAALAAALAGGVALDKAVGALATFEGLARRFTVSAVAEFTLIDDAYNASPAGFVAALDTLKALPAQRRYVIAGDMLELGAQAEQYHRELGILLATSRLAGLVTVGELAHAAGEAALRHGLPRARWTACPNPQAAVQTLRPRLLAGDAVLVKGSHGMHLEECCALLRQGPQPNLKSEI